MPQLRLVAGILGTLILGSAAEARTPRFNRPDIQVPVTLGDRVKPLAPKPASSAQPVVAIDMVLSVPWLHRPVRTEQQAIIEQLIATTPDSQAEEKADYLFRLSELYASQQRFWRIKAAEAQIASDAATDAARKTQLRNDSNAAANKAKDFLLKTVKAMKALTDNQAFSSYPKMDVALFNYGYTLQSGKYMKEARAVYDKLLRSYPNSQYVPEAHLSFAEYYFESGQLADAEARYKMVLKFPKSTVYAYAKYKLGWIHQNLQRYQESLETFFEVARVTRGNTAQAALNHAAKLDFVRAYAEIGKPEKAYPAFQRVDGAAALEMLETLGQIYVDQGKSDRAAYVHMELMKLSPVDARVCDWQYRTARGMLSMPGATNTDKIKAVQNLVKLHGALAAKGNLPVRELQDCRANAIAMSTELARAWHSEATKTRNPETLTHAVALYQAYVDGFPAEPDRADYLHLRAEAMWTHAATEPNDRIQVSRWDAASTAFIELARADAKRTASASRAAVLAWMNGHDDGALSSGAVPELTQGKPPARPLAAEHQQLVDAIGVFAASTNARDPELAALRFVEANLYRQANQHDKAAAIYGALVATHPGETFAEAAAALAIDSLVLLQRLDEMLLLADKLAADTAFLSTKPDLTRIVKHVRSRSMRR